MGLFGFGKKNKIVDLSEGYKRQQEKIKKQEQEQKAQDSGGFSFLGNLASSGAVNSRTPQSDYPDLSSDVEEKRKRLTKRLADLTDKLEELSNQIYHLQQRIELLE